MAMIQRTTMVPKVETLCGHYLKDKDGKKYFASIERDKDPKDPRTSMCNLSHMVCWHRRYDLGDKHNFDNVKELIDQICNWERSGEKVYCQPLFLLDHSGLSISTRDFNDRYDSGCVGMVYVLKSELIRAGFHFENTPWKNVAAGIVEDEVGYYDQYLRGEVYGYRLFEVNGDEFIDTDSCWGFYGNDPRTNGIFDMLGYLEVLSDEEV